MKLKILVVDDEPIVRRGMTAIIEKASPDWQVIGQEANGADALRFMNKEMPDVLITDIRMASMDGISLSRTARQKWPDLIIIVVSGYSEFEYAKEAVRFGAIDYLLKPTSPSELIRVLKKAEEVLLASEKTKIEKMLLTDRKEKEEEDGQEHRRRLVEDAITYMSRNYAKDLTTRDMADILHLNSNYFCDLFKKETGTTFLNYLTEIRMKAAMRLLEEKVNIRIYELAEQVGYTDSRYFNRIFRRETGMTPSEYRESYLRKNEKLL